MNAVIDVTGIRIETARLILRPWYESDLNDLYEYACVPGVGEMAGWLHHNSIEDSKTVLKMFQEEKKTFALELKENRKVIGSIGMEPLDLRDAPELRGREIGYVLSKDYWGRGLMVEAVKEAIDYCFKNLDFDWLTCGHFSWNNQSQRVIEKCGFKFFKEIVRKTQSGTEETTKIYILFNPNKK